jgi:hypothetical protein
VDAALIKAVVENFGLFSFTDDGKRFYSESMLRRMGEIERIRALRSDAGKKGVVVKAQQNIDNEDISAGETGKAQAKPKQNSSKTQVKPEQTLSKPQASLLKEKEKESKEKEREKELPCGSSKETAAVAASLSSSEIYKTSGKAVKCEGKPLAEREADFRKAVDAFVGKYQKEMLEAFKDHYTAHAPDALRMRFEKDKEFFDIERKLKDWERREQKFYATSRRGQAQESDEEAMRKRKQDEEYKKQKAREQAARDAQKKKEWEEQLAEAGITPEMTEGMSVFERMDFIHKRLEEFEKKKKSNEADKEKRVERY